ncbi:MAG: GSU2403 family nucleotidyltransferase fold protein [Kiloniellaceae bacterium]
MKINELPIAVQTVYADLVEKAWTGDLAQLAAGPGAPYKRETGGRAYWYWQPATEHGRRRPSARYIGPDNEATRKRLDALNDQAAGLRERRDMVRSLRGARLPYPDALTGDVLAAMAEAGVFRLRAVLVGSVAFQSYIGMLGVRLPASLSRTGDVDLAQFHAIALAVEDEIDRDLEEVLKAVDKRFTAVLDPMDSRRTLRYALRIGKEERFSVDVLCPLRGPERDRKTRLRALRSHAQLLRFLDFLLYQEVNAVVLHGAGIPINVPDPTRFALHKLLVSQMRIAIPRSQEKAKKDLDQAEALITVLARQRPGDLKDLWEDLRERGPSWRRKADRSLLQLSEETRALLED